MSLCSCWRYVVRHTRLMHRGPRFSPSCDDTIPFAPGPSWDVSESHGRPRYQITPTCRTLRGPGKVGQPCMSLLAGWREADSSVQSVLSDHAEVVAQLATDLLNPTIHRGPGGRPCNRLAGRRRAGGRRQCEEKGDRLVAGKITEGWTVGDIHKYRHSGRNR
jgi:hypothetical protein